MKFNRELIKDLMKENKWKVDMDGEILFKGRNNDKFVIFLFWTLICLRLMVF